LTVFDPIFADKKGPDQPGVKLSFTEIRSRNYAESAT